MVHRYTLRWKNSDGAEKQQSGSVMALRALADYLADEVREIVLGGGSDIRIERTREG